MVIEFINWPKNLPTGHKIYQHLPLQDHPKFTQNGIFGFKIYHLATLVATVHIGMYIHAWLNASKQSFNRLRKEPNANVYYRYSE
jgi:hypothetical protein